MTLNGCDECMMGISKTAFYADPVLDCLPVVSTVTNGVHLIEKLVIKTLLSCGCLKESFLNKSYCYNSIRHKSVGRCVLLMIPVFGQLGVGIYTYRNWDKFCAKREQLKDLVRQAYSPPLEETNPPVKVVDPQAIRKKQIEEASKKAEIALNNDRWASHEERKVVKDIFITLKAGNLSSYFVKFGGCACPSAVPRNILHTLTSEGIIWGWGYGRTSMQVIWRQPSDDELAAYVNNENGDGRMYFMKENQLFYSPIVSGEVVEIEVDGVVGKEHPLKGYDILWE